MIFSAISQSIQIIENDKKPSAERVADMTPYQPSARRPIAALFRRTADLVVRWCVRLDIHPNWVSYSSMVAAGLAALCFV
jgi:hypothetical protein